MTDLPTIQRLTVTPVPCGEGAVMDAVALDADGTQAALFLEWPGSDEPVLQDAVLLERRDLPRGAILRVQLAAPGKGAIGFAGGAPVPIALRAPDTALFAGHRVMLGHNNGEPAAAVADWLGWHRRHHGADAALIVDRSDPATGGADALAAMLAGSAALEGYGRVVILDFSRPLGMPGAGPESHPLHAPEAPGKDRMTAPEEDRWAAPLGWPVLYDFLRERFLSAAAGVANVETMDLVLPGPNGRSMFDLAAMLPLGVLPLKGERIYPWGVRADADAGFGDHICRRFDSTASDNRWCAVPALATRKVIWMPFRILGAKTATAPLRFLRAMALRHGDGARISQIVPKSSLVEGADLLAISAELGADPVRVPANEADQAQSLPTRAVHGNRTAIVTTMKNEGPFILEWLAYHRAIGVEDFLVYTNDCSDGTDDFLRLLMAKGLVQWRENPYRESGLKPQHAALEAAVSEPLIRDADWAICMDVDEYIAVHVGDGTLAALYDAVPDANMISLTWRLFGNADVDEFRDEFITQRFTRAAREFANKPHQAWGFKTLFRNVGLFRKLGVHRPKGMRPTAPARINWVNGSGKALPENQWRTAWRSHSGTYGYDLATLNHYAVRSAESFLVKRDRGRVNHVDRDQGMAYWFRMNHNVVEDTRMHRMLPLLSAEYDRLMADPDIAAMHRACVEAHRAKIDELKAQPSYQTFHAELNSPRARSLSRLHGHFGSAVYIAGPEVIPDEIASKHPDEDFFFTVDYTGETRH